jgi:hypothetical protein
VEQGESSRDVPGEVFIRRCRLRERCAQVGARASAGGAYFGYRMVTAHDGDCLAVLDRVQQVREVPGRR